MTSDDTTDSAGGGGSFTGQRPLEVSIGASGLADLASVDVNGTELILKQHDHIPTLVELYVENEERPLGVINIDKGCTVTLGGIEEALAGEMETMSEKLREVEKMADEADALAARLNPTTRGRQNGDSGGNGESVAED